MPVEAWSALPPEVNATRILGGSGVASWQAMAATWTAMAGIVDTEIAALTSASGVLGGGWVGKGGTSAIEGISPFMPWLLEMGAIATKNALACQAVVTAHMTALASMVPAGAVSVNRASATIAETSAQASAAAAAVPGVIGMVSGVKHMQDQATVAELESQYAGMWESNAMAMTNYDMAVTNATQVVAPPPPPPPISSTAGANIFNPESFAKQPGTGQLAQSMLQQLNPGQLLSTAQSTAQSAVSTARSGMSSVSSPQGFSGGHSSPWGQYAGQHARTLSDAEFRRMLGGLASGRGGLHSFPRMSSGGGLHGGGAVARGLGGSGTSAGSLGLRSGTTPAMPAAVFSGVPTSAPPPSTPMSGSPMMSPLGGARGVRSGAEDRHSAQKVLDQDSWLQHLSDITQANTLAGVARQTEMSDTASASVTPGEQQKTQAE